MIPHIVTPALIGIASATGFLLSHYHILPIWACILVGMGVFVLEILFAGRYSLWD